MDNNLLDKNGGCRNPNLSSEQISQLKNRLGIVNTRLATASSLKSQFVSRYSPFLWKDADGSFPLNKQPEHIQKEYIRIITEIENLSKKKKEIEAKLGIESE